MAKRRHRRPKGISRRKFLQYSAGASVLLGTGSMLGCGDDNERAGPNPTPTPTPTGAPLEPRTYVFDLAHMDTSAHDIILVAGKRRVPVASTTPEVLVEVRRRHPILSRVPDARLTHYVSLDMPAAAVGICYLQRIAHGTTNGDWDMALLFYHHPSSALREADRRRRRRHAVPPVPQKWLAYGLTPELRASFDDPVGEEVLQDTNSQAVALVAGYPELAAGEPNSAADIQTNIIATQPATGALGSAINAQGPATTDGGWATQTPLLDDSGQPYLNSQGQKQYVPVWSSLTGEYGGQAIGPSLDMAKDTTDLGVNVSDIDPTGITTNDANAPTNGAIWTVQDGMPTVDQTSPTGLQESSVDYQLTNQSPGHGYSLKVNEVGVNSAGNVTVTVECKNWYVRYLSIFIRYLDGNDQPIPLSSVASEIQNAFPNWNPAYNGTYDAYLDLLYPQWQVIGIPVKAKELEKTIPVPREAASVQILAGGMGSGDDPFPGTIDQGVAMTAIFNLSVPALLLSLMAAAGYGTLTESLEESETAREVLEEALEFFAWGGINYEDTEGFQELAVEIGEKLLSSGAAKIDALIAASIAEGESIEAVEDAIPIVGAFLSAIWAIGLIASIAETSTQVAQSPRTYVDTVRFTHDVEVTIAHDPNDPAGFPATATHYVVTALFDGGTPRTIMADMPGTTVTQPIKVTFQDVPAGGQVKVDVAFYSATEFLVGRGTVGPVANTATEGVLDLGITIEELLVPLTSTTKYSHKEIIALDANGNHVWQGTTNPPTVVTPEGLCENVNGQICEWTGITVSTSNAAVGYAWQAYNSAVRDCTSNTSGQLHQWANIAVTENPQSKYLFSGCGFGGTTRIVYDLLGKPNWNFYLDTSGGGNYIRQIRLDSSPASYDSPTSNRAWGQLQFPSDAMLLHPLGKIISVNTARNKIEVLDLADQAVPDADAPRSQVRSGVGTREGLLNGPVLAAVTAQGTILVLEAINNRIQAFDIGGNPAPIFAGDAYHFSLADPPGAATYLDLAVEYMGYIYVLSYTGSGSSASMYRLDIYTPDGEWLARTTNVAAAKVGVNYWRDIFTLNYQVLRLPNGSYPNRTEPSVSHWIPSTP